MFITIILNIITPLCKLSLVFLLTHDNKGIITKLEVSNKMQKLKKKKTLSSGATEEKKTLLHIVFLSKCFRNGFSPIKKKFIMVTTLKLCDTTDDVMTEYFM